MIRKESILLLSAFALTMLCTGSLLAQTSMIHWLRITDTHGANDTATMVYGNHDLATYNIDLTLGELASPPDPPSFFARWLGITGRPKRPDSTYGLLFKDLREIPTPLTKKDTFSLKVKNPDGADADNMIISWPSGAHVTDRCDSMVLVIIGDPTGASGLPPRVNMATTSTVTVLNPYMITDVGGWNATAPELKFRIYKYGTKQPDIDAVRRESNLIPSDFGLNQNYPNPFNPTTNFTFDIRNQGMTDIAIYNLLGQKVATLVAKELPVGTYSATGNGTNDEGVAVNSGVYFVSMSVHVDGVSTFSAVRKMVLMK